MTYVLHYAPDNASLIVRLALEHRGLPYRAALVDRAAKAQETTGFRKLNPNGLIPVLETPEGPLFETGAILLYLAEKFGAFLPQDPTRRTEALSWLFWQMGSAPYLGGGFGHFYAYAPEKFEYPINRFAMETKRQLDVMDKHLAEHEYFADEYSIADMACWPWVSRYEWQQIDLTEYPNVRAWYQRLRARDAVQKGYHVPKVMGDIPEG